MRINERTPIVTKARLDLEEVFLEWWRTHENLTYLETLHCLHQVTAQPIKYALRSERHPNDPEKKADEA